MEKGQKVVINWSKVWEGKEAEVLEVEGNVVTVLVAHPTYGNIVEVEFNKNHLDVVVEANESNLEEVIEKIVNDRVARIMAPLKEIASKYNLAELKEMKKSGKLSFKTYMDVTQIERTERIIRNQIATSASKITMKIENKLGHVYSAQLKDNQKGGFDGVIKSENGTAYIETILAGGWNVQSAHYRTLIKIK